MITTTREIAQQLAKRGRVRDADDESTVGEIVRRVRGTKGVGLLHDGAGWDAQRIADETGYAVTRVRADVLKARLEAAEADCRPCADQVDGLMTFTADAMAHAMTCEQCKATREALRTGKGKLRTHWTDDTPAPRRPWEDRPAGRVGTDLAEDDTVIQTTSLAAQEPRQADGRSRADRDADAIAHLTSDEDFEEIIRRDRAGGFAVMRLGDGTDASEPTSAGEEHLFEARRLTGTVFSLPNRTPSPPASPAPRPPAHEPSTRRRPLSAPVAMVLAAVLALTLVAAVAADSGPEAGETAQLAEDDSRTDQSVPQSEPTAVDATAIAEPNDPPRPTPTADVLDDRAAAETLQLIPLPPRSMDRLEVQPKPLLRPLPSDRLIAPPAPAAEPDEPAPVEPQPAPEPAPEPAGPATPTPQIWEDLAMCESSGNWAANTGNGYYGGLQFLLSSWEFVGGTGLPSDAPKAEQIQRAHALWELQGWKAWPVCSRRLGLR